MPAIPPPGAVPGVTQTGAPAARAGEGVPSSPMSRRTSPPQVITSPAKHPPRRLFFPLEIVAHAVWLSGWHRSIDAHSEQSRSNPDVLMRASAGEWVASCGIARIPPPIITLSHSRCLSWPAPRPYLRSGLHRSGTRRRRSLPPRRQSRLRLSGAASVASSLGASDRSSDAGREPDEQHSWIVGHANAFHHEIATSRS